MGGDVGSTCIQALPIHQLNRRLSTSFKGAQKLFEKSNLQEMNVYFSRSLTTSLIVMSSKSNWTLTGTDSFSRGKKSFLYPLNNFSESVLLKTRSSFSRNKR